VDAQSRRMSLSESHPVHYPFLHLLPSRPLLPRLCTASRFLNRASISPTKLTSPWSPKPLSPWEISSPLVHLRQRRPANHPQFPGWEITYLLRSMDPPELHFDTPPQAQHHSLPLVPKRVGWKATSGHSESRPDANFIIRNCTTHRRGL